MHDTAELEAAGIPSVGIYSSAFERQAAFQAEKLGFEAAARLFIQHPISDQTDEQLKTKAESVIDGIVSALTDPEFSNAAFDGVDADDEDDGEGMW
eukprot:m.46244 g.46244  ORF g.46244 m.46244 type:complete len:96 (-) comp6735_c1_seq1:106-393(-)